MKWDALIKTLHNPDADPVERHDALTEMYQRALACDPSDMRLLADELDELYHREYPTLPVHVSRAEYPDSRAWFLDEVSAHADALTDAADDAEEWARCRYNPNLYYGVPRGA